MSDSCEICGISTDQFSAALHAVSELKEEKTALEHELTRKAVEIGRLKAQITAQHRAKSDLKNVRKIFDLWVQHTGRNPKRTKLGDERIKAVQSMIDLGYPMEDFEQAMRNAGTHAFVDERGKTHNDLTLICRNSAKFEDFRDRHKTNRGPSSPPKGTEAQAGYSMLEPIDFILEALNRYGLGWSATTDPDLWEAKCPAHPPSKDEGPLLIARTDEGAVTLNCFSGCDEAAVLAALHLTPSYLNPPEPAPVGDDRGSQTPCKEFRPCPQK